MFFVEETICRLTNEFDKISLDRKSVLRDVASLIQSRHRAHRTTDLVFICTHNSRRSHIAQIWAQTLAAFFKISYVRAFSGGTEATAFNPKAVNALRNLGFRIDQITSGSNPHYRIEFSDSNPPIEVYSKKYEDAGNPTRDFVAIMTCTDADQECPVVGGASHRVSLPYDDPKVFDGTSEEVIKYHERSIEIGREILFLFSQVKNQ